MKFRLFSATLVVLLFYLMQGCGEVRDTQNVVPVDEDRRLNLNIKNSFFPLAVGNWWKYRCSVEGEVQFEKTLAIVSRVIRNGQTYYKAERGSLDDLLVVYFYQDENGQIHEVFDPNSQDDEVITTRTMMIGDLVGELRVTRYEFVCTPATGKVKAAVAENFKRDEPNLSADRLLEWRGVFYAKDIGPIVEADGLGGDCILIEYKVK